MGAPEIGVQLVVEVQLFTTDPDSEGVYVTRCYQRAWQTLDEVLKEATDAVLRGVAGAAAVAGHLHPQSVTSAAHAQLLRLAEEKRARERGEA